MTVPSIGSVFVASVPLDFSMVTVACPVPTNSRGSFLSEEFVMFCEDIVLSPSFTLKDFAICEDPELHLDNQKYALHMGEIILDPLRNTALRAEEIQQILGHKIKIRKGLVSPSTNSRLLNSSPNSLHVTGDALDFTCPEFGSVYQVCKKLESSYFPFDQLYNVRDHVHVSFRTVRMLTKSYIGHNVSFITGILNV